MDSVSLGWLELRLGLEVEMETSVVPVPHTGEHRGVIQSPPPESGSPPVGLFSLCWELE